MRLEIALTQACMVLNNTAALVAKHCTFYMRELITRGHSVAPLHLLSLQLLR